MTRQVAAQVAIIPVKRPRIGIKSKIQTIYVNNGQFRTANNPEGVDFNLLKSAISQVPATEISEDIENMYNFIVSKIN